MAGVVKVRKRALTGVGAALLLGLCSLTVGQVAYAGPDDVCMGTKVDVQGSYTELTLTAPDGFLISGYCVKAGSTNQDLGPEYVAVDPPAATVTISSSSGKDISHYSLTYVPVASPSSTTSTGTTSTTSTGTTSTTSTGTATTSTSTTTTTTGTGTTTTTAPPTTTGTETTGTATSSSSSTTTTSPGESITTGNGTGGGAGGSGAGSGTGSVAGSVAGSGNGSVAEQGSAQVFGSARSTALAFTGTNVAASLLVAVLLLGVGAAALAGRRGRQH